MPRCYIDISDGNCSHIDSEGVELAGAGYVRQPAGGGWRGAEMDDLRRWPAFLHLAKRTGLVDRTAKRASREPVMTTTNFAAELTVRAKEKGPIVVGLAGAGQMGTDIVVQVGPMPGMRIGA
eukprot:gene40521-53587_t